MAAISWNAGIVRRRDLPSVPKTPDPRADDHVSIAGAGMQAVSTGSSWSMLQDTSSLDRKQDVELLKRFAIFGSSVVHLPRHCC